MIGRIIFPHGSPYFYPGSGKERSPDITGVTEAAYHMLVVFFILFPYWNRAALPVAHPVLAVQLALSIRLCSR